MFRNRNSTTAIDCRVVKINNNIKIAFKVKTNTKSKVKLHVAHYSTTVIATIKEMPQSLFYDIPCYVTMDYEKFFDTSEEIRAFEVQNHVNYM